MYSEIPYTTEQIRDLCIAGLDKFKISDITCIDLNGNSSVADLMIIGTGTSRLHTGAAANNLENFLAEHKIRGVGLSGGHESKWVILDVGNVVVHIMVEEDRQRFRLEDLYKCMAAGVSEADTI